MNKLTNVLLATTSFVAISASPANAVLFFESSLGGGDFSDDSNNPTILSGQAAGIDAVGGALSGSDNQDFFTFDFAFGTDVWVTFERTSGAATLTFSADFIGGLTSVNVNPGAPMMVQGFVPIGGLTIGVQTLGNTSCCEGFRVTLEAHPVPEPETILLFGVGLAGLAVAGRRRKKI